MNTKLLTIIFIISLIAGSMAQERTFGYHLERGELQKARELVSKALTTKADNSEFVFQLALIQVLQGLERYSAKLYHLGLKPSPMGNELPFLRLPVPPNPNPGEASNEEMRQALEQLKSDLLIARGTLSTIPDDWKGKVSFRVGAIHLDLDGNGVISEDEQLWRVLDQLNPALGLEEKKATNFELSLDAGDVRWLEGYCNLLSGLIEVVLAHDTQALFDRTGHLFFSRTRTPFPYLASSGQHSVFSVQTISDVVAFVHLLNLPVLTPEKLEAALGHFEETIRLSRRSWNCILEETDNDLEWLPNPTQISAAAGWTVNQDMIIEWFKFLDESEAALSGTKLIPFWREVEPGVGLNLRRVFTEPTTFDLVLWVQGSAASPYLEPGETVSREMREQLRRTFDGRFFGFALWFN